MSRLSLACLVVMACSGDPDATQRAPVAPAAATAFAKTFAPDLFGNIVPLTPREGDYAMALTMTFDSRPSMEMQIVKKHTGALKLTLAGDGTTRACLGSRRDDAILGQYEYEPPQRRGPARKTEDVELMGLAGHWSIVDGIATIQFDQMSRWTCDLTNAFTMAKPVAKLRCIGVGPTDRVPGGSLACEASEDSWLLDLGMDMTSASRNVAESPAHLAPTGRNIVLGVLGLVVDVSQGANDVTPAVTFRSGAVTLIEADYRASK